MEVYAYQPYMPVQAFNFRGAVLLPRDPEFARILQGCAVRWQSRQQGRSGPLYLMLAWVPRNSILLTSSADSTHPRPSQWNALIPGHSPHCTGGIRRDQSY